MKKIICFLVVLIITIPSICCADMGKEERINALNETMSMSLDILNSLHTVYTIQPELMNEEFAIMAYEYYLLYITAYEMSQIEETREYYDLRAGMGLSYIQIGIPYRIFVIAYEVEEGKFDRYVVVNPKIKSVSEEIVYIGEGEGCLSVNRPTEGIVPRHARMTIEAYDEYGKQYTLRVREELAVCFQHELDHLDGILFTDRIDKKDPFKGKDIYRAI